MGLMSHIFTKEKNPTNRFQEIKKSFKERWYDKELDSLYNTKQHTTAERLLHQIVDYNTELVSAITTSSKDITILTSPADHSNDIYNCIYELSKIFTQGKQCERDVFNLCINIAKMTIMICNNLENIDDTICTTDLTDVLEKILLSLGDHDINVVFKNQITYPNIELGILLAQFYRIYAILYRINSDIVYYNKVYRNNLKHRSSKDFDDIGKM